VAVRYDFLLFVFIRFGEIHSAAYQKNPQSEYYPVFEVVSRNAFDPLCGLTNWKGDRRTGKMPKKDSAVDYYSIRRDSCITNSGSLFSFSSGGMKVWWNFSTEKRRGSDFKMETIGFDRGIGG